MAEPAAPAVAVAGLEKRYGETPVLRGVDLSVPKGQFVALVGASGSGKTTLLKCLNRLIEADAGSIRIAGADARSLPAPELRRRIGYVFQETGLFPHMSVGENIAITPRLMGREDLAGRVDELLDLVSLPRTFAARAPSELSGGQRQRVGVARALAAEPALVLMDEPFGALDPATRVNLGDAYRDLHARLGLTTLMVTHDMAEALLLADRVVVMKDGRLVADAAPAALLAGAPPPDVAALVDPPRRQAERLAALARGGDAHRANAGG